MDEDIRIHRSDLLYSQLHQETEDLYDLSVYTCTNRNHTNYPTSLHSKHEKAYPSMFKKAEFRDRLSALTRWAEGSRLA